MTPQLINLLSAMFRAPQVDAAPIAAKAKKAKAEPGRKPAGSTRAGHQKDRKVPKRPALTISGSPSR